MGYCDQSHPHELTSIREQSAGHTDHFLADTQVSIGN